MIKTVDPVSVLLRSKHRLIQRSYWAKVCMEYVVKACSAVQCVVPAVAILDVRKKEVGSTCLNIF